MFFLCGCMHYAGEIRKYYYNDHSILIWMNILVRFEISTYSDCQFQCLRKTQAGEWHDYHMWRRWFRKNSVFRMSFMSTLKMQIPWVQRVFLVDDFFRSVWIVGWNMETKLQAIFLKFVRHIVAWQSQWTIIKFQLCIDCPPLYTSSVSKLKFIMIVLQ